MQNVFTALDGNAQVKASLWGAKSGLIARRRDIQIHGGHWKGELDISRPPSPQSKESFCFLGPATYTSVWNSTGGQELLTARGTPIHRSWDTNNSYHLPNFRSTADQQWSGMPACAVFFCLPDGFAQWRPMRGLCCCCAPGEQTLHVFMWGTQLETEAFSKVFMLSRFHRLPAALGISVPETFN